MSDAPARVNLFLEDFEIGEVFKTGARTIGEGMVDAFAGLTGDLHPVHVDEGAARAGLYGARIAHGMLSLSILQGLIVQTRYDLDTGVATVGWEKLRFPAPVFFGDTVRGEFTIKEARPSKSRPELGVVVEDCRLLNQRDEIVVSGEHVVMIRRRPPA